MKSDYNPLFSHHQNIQQHTNDDSEVLLQPKCRCLCRYWLPRRYCFVLLSFFGLFNVYAMRVNLSVAIEPMSCQFNWDPFKQGLILAAFFCGYLFGNIPGGWLAEKYGGKIIFGLGVLCTALLSIILPFCTSGSFLNDNTLSCHCLNDTDWCFNEGNYTNNDDICDNILNNCSDNSYIYILLILRFLMGLFESVTFPSLYALFNHWCPPNERSRMVGISFAGMYIGNALGFPISLFLIASKSNIYGGWPNVFYFFSIIGILWWILWSVFVYKSPFNDPFISGKEMNYLRNELPKSLITKFSKKIKLTNNVNDDNEEFNENNNVSDKNEDKIPWFQAFTNKYAVALYIAHFSYNWTNYTLLVELPTYLNDELKFQLSSSGFISVLPYLSQFVVSCLASILVDKLIIYKVFSRTLARKISQTIGSVLPAILLVICGYLNNVTYVVILLSISTGLMGLVNSGFASNFTDISPTMSGILFGISNTIATIPGVVSPILSGWILNGNKNKKTKWKIIFYIAFMIFTIGTILYWILGTAEYVKQLNTKKRSNSVIVNIDQDVKSIHIIPDDSVSKTKTKHK